MTTAVATPQGGGTDAWIALFAAATTRTVRDAERYEDRVEAPELLDAFNDLERRLASPEGDTRHSGPSRRVPYRR